MIAPGGDDHCQSAPLGGHPQRASRLRQLGDEAAAQHQVIAGWLCGGKSAHVVLLIGAASRRDMDARPTWLKTDFD